VNEKFKRIKKGYMVAQLALLSLNFSGRIEANVSKPSQSLGHPEYETGVLPI
jgi:hypothetical protein